MRATAVLASAARKPATVVTVVVCCSSRRWLTTICMGCSPATGWSLVTAPAKTFMPEGAGGGGAHAPHATGQLVHAME